jgi:competence protein ComEC
MKNASLKPGLVSAGSFVLNFLRAKRRLPALLICAALSCLRLEARNTLQVYFVDVEGGQATLFVTPRGESLLIDTGWPGYAGRDAERIVSSARQAGINHLDYVLITHFHEDHAGGITELARRIPIDTVIDHGENRERTDARTEEIWQAYQRFLQQAKPKRIIAKPGDVLPVHGMEAEIVTSDGAIVEHPLASGGDRNPACQTSERRPQDTTENQRSLGAMIQFGRLRIVDLGDLTWDKEMELMCPVNRLGTADIYIVSHHGSNQSGSPALVDALSPRIAIMDNGARKGGSPSAWEIVRHSPRLEDLWQLHYSEEGGREHNSPAPFIANVSGPDKGNYLRLTASEDGSFEVFNSRTHETKHYAPAH